MATEPTDISIKGKFKLLYGYNSGGLVVRIKRVHIKNFRCLEDVEVEFDSITTFIGPNGTGKSTVLRALDWFFNGPKSSELTEADITFGAESKQISVEVEFSDLSAEDREALGHYVADGVDKFVAWKYREEGGAERMTGNAKVFTPFNEIRSAGSATEAKRLYSALRAERSELSLPSAASKDAINEAMTAWELENTDQLTDSEVQTSFFGFNSQGKIAELFDYVFVGADLRASEEAVDGKSTVIGKILERAVNRQSADEEIARLSEEVNAQQREIYNRNFEEQLAGISTSLSEAVAQYSTGRSVRVQTKDLELQPPKTQFEVSVLDNTIETKITRQGHGFQRTLLIAALQLLARKGVEESSHGTICLAIEEPELFQHPIQAQAFSQVLRKLVSDDSEKIQVTYATHSPYFVDPSHFNEIRRVSRGLSIEATKSPAVTIASTTVAKIQTKLASYVTTEQVEKQVGGVCLNRLPEGLFANGVVLVEGTTDLAAIEGSASREAIGGLSLSGIVVAEVGGKSNLFLAHAVLEELGIPSYVIFDGDKESRARMTVAGKSQKKINDTEENNKKLNRSLLKYLGATEEDWPTSGTYDKYAVFEDMLETWLKAEWPEWEAEKDNIEAAGLGNVGKNELLYRYAAAEASTNPPQLMDDILTNIRQVL